MNIQQTLTEYLNRNKFNMGINDGDLLIICEDGQFTAHLNVIKRASAYVKNFADNYSNSTNNKNDNNDNDDKNENNLLHKNRKIEFKLLNYEMHVAKNVICWLYQKDLKLEELSIPTHNFRTYFSILELVNLLELNKNYDIGTRLYYDFIKNKLQKSSSVKKNWPLLLSFIDGKEVKYFKSIKKDIFDCCKKEIRDYVISYMLDIVHSEYLGDNKKSLNKFNGFLDGVDYSLSLDLKHEIIVTTLGIYNSEKEITKKNTK